MRKVVCDREGGTEGEEEKEKKRKRRQREGKGEEKTQKGRERERKGEIFGLLFASSDSYVENLSKIAMIIAFIWLQCSHQV